MECLQGFASSEEEANVAFENRIFLHLLRPLVPTPPTAGCAFFFSVVVLGPLVFRADIFLFSSLSASKKNTKQQSRDIHLESFTLLFHGHELLTDAKLELNYGR